MAKWSSRGIQVNAIHTRNLPGMFVDRWKACPPRGPSPAAFGAVSRTVAEGLQVERFAEAPTRRPSYPKQPSYHIGASRRTGRSPQESRSKRPGSVIPVPCYCRTDLRLCPSLCAANAPTVKQSSLLSWCQWRRHTRCAGKYV